MKLTLSDMAEVAEVIAAIAIVISLIFVGIQVADNTRAIRSSNANAASTMTQNYYQTVGSNLQNASVWLKGVTNPSELSPNELVQFIHLMHFAVLGFQNTYYLVEEGTLDIDVSNNIINSMLAVKGKPGFQLYWSQRKSLLSDGFVNFVEENIITGTATVEASVIYNYPVTNPE